MATAWLCAGEPLAAAIGDGSRVILGASTGWLLVIVAAEIVGPPHAPQHGRH